MLSYQCLSASQTWLISLSEENQPETGSAKVQSALSYINNGKNIVGCSNFLRFYTRSFMLSLDFSRVFGPA